MPRQSVCFVVMPFRDEFNFFFLYLAKYLEEKHHLKVLRGDSAVLTKALMEKLRDQIFQADVVIADVTGSNPNVFYELGLAHAYRKPVIHLTQDPPKDVPVDIRQFEFIEYSLGRHEELLKKLDNAVHNIFVERYQEFYGIACNILAEFNADMGTAHMAASIEEFQTRVRTAEQIEPLPSSEQPELLASFLLPKVLEKATELKIMKQVTDWLSKKLPPKD
jgi:hypothetical protein